MGQIFTQRGVESNRVHVLPSENWKKAQTLVAGQCVKFEIGRNWLAAHCIQVQPADIDREDIPSFKSIFSTKNISDKV